MGTRIPFRIYRLKQSTGPKPEDSLSPQNYLVDLTIDNVNFYHEPPVITIKQENIPGNLGKLAAGSSIEAPKQTLEVLHDLEADLYYVIVDTTGTGNVPMTLASTTQQILYIRNPKKNVLTPLPDVFEFYVNPQNLTPTSRKIITETRTRGGWEVQHWGEQLTEIRVQGKSGGMHKDAGRPLARGKPVTQSTAWLRLSQLKRLYDADHSIKNSEDLTLLAMNYYDRYYIGYFVEFTGPTANAANPFQVDYGFTFKVQSEISSDVFDVKTLTARSS